MTHTPTAAPNAPPKHRGTMADVFNIGSFRTSAVTNRITQTKSPVEIATTSMSMSIGLLTPLTVNSIDVYGREQGGNQDASKHSPPLPGHEETEHAKSEDRSGVCPEVVQCDRSRARCRIAFGHGASLRGKGRCSLAARSSLGLSGPRRGRESMRRHDHGGSVATDLAGSKHPVAIVSRNFIREFMWLHGTMASVGRECAAKTKTGHPCRRMTRFVEIFATSRPFSSLSDERKVSSHDGRRHCPRADVHVSSIIQLEPKSDANGAHSFRWVELNCGVSLGSTPLPPTTKIPTFGRYFCIYRNNFLKISMAR